MRIRLTRRQLAAAWLAAVGGGAGWLWFRPDRTPIELSLPVPGDLGYGTGITDDGGIAIFNASGTAVDQVGLSAGSAYKDASCSVSPALLALSHFAKSRPTSVSSVAGALAGDSATAVVLLWFTSFEGAR